MKKRPDPRRVGPISDQPNMKKELNRQALGAIKLAVSPTIH